MTQQAISNTLFEIRPTFDMAEMIRESEQRRRQNTAR